MTHDSYSMNHYKLVFFRSIGLIDPRPGGKAGNKGFTLVELIVVMAILGVLALMSIPVYNSYINKAKNSRAVSDIRTMSTEISAYYMDRGTYPINLGIINRGGFKDPWDRPYVYNTDVVVGGTPLWVVSNFETLNTDYDLYSKGSDGMSELAGGFSVNDNDIVRSNDGSFIGLRP